MIGEGTFRDAVASVGARPLRALLTALGTIVGVATLVATVGLATTATQQISERFDEVASTEVRVRASAPEASSARAWQLPDDAVDRLVQVGGVVSASATATVDTGDSLSSRWSLEDSSMAPAIGIEVLAVDDQYFEVIEPKVEWGRTWDRGHSQRAENVAVVGSQAAVRLGLQPSAAGRQAVFVEEDAFAVLGVIDVAGRDPLTANRLIIPLTTADAVFGTPGADELLIRTLPGAGSYVASVAPTVLAPETPTHVAVQFDDRSTAVRGQIAGDLTALLLALAGLGLLIGGIGIGNVTLVSVLERRTEIGLRRALGFQRRHVAIQFLIESALVGGVGGTIGANLGVLAVAGVSGANGWDPAMPIWLPLTAPVGGALVGVIAGTYPSFRASKIEPMSALRTL